jgi:hypothetical protein
MTMIIIGLLLIAVITAFLLIPTWVAFHRRHNSRWAIFALNFFLGGTVIGWIWALVWSLTGDVPAPPASPLGVAHTMASRMSQSTHAVAPRLEDDIGTLVHRLDVQRRLPARR